MKLKMKQGRAVEKYRPVASILSYDVLELPDFMQEIKDVDISAYR